MRTGCNGFNVRPSCQAVLNVVMNKEVEICKLSDQEIFRMDCAAPS